MVNVLKIDIPVHTWKYMYSVCRQGSSIVYDIATMYIERQTCVAMLELTKAAGMF